MSPRKRNPHSNGSTPHEPLHDDSLLPDPVREEESSPALLMERRPEVYQKIVDYLESGMSPGGAAALCNISVGLARKIRNSLGTEILHAAIRQTGRNLVEVTQQMSERLVAEGHKIPIAQIPQSLSMMVDKSMLISGAPTARVEHTRVPSQEDLIRMFNALPKAKATAITPPPPSSDTTPSASDTRPPSLSPESGQRSPLQ